MFLIDKSFWEVRNTKKKGKGVFALKPISKGIVIGDYAGKLVHIKNIDFEKEKKNLYLMRYVGEIGIYPNLKKPGVHLINHSCSPNCFLYKYKDRTLIFALRNIQKGEEITIHYLLPPKISCKKCTHVCFCGSNNCSGSMHLSEKKYKIWQGFQKKQKSNINKKIIKQCLLELLSNYPKSIPNNYIAKITYLRII
jgi:SET domain-containing protein